MVSIGKTQNNRPEQHRDLHLVLPFQRTTGLRTLTQPLAGEYFGEKLADFDRIELRHGEAPVDYVEV